MDIKTSSRREVTFSTTSKPSAGFAIPGTTRLSQRRRKVRASSTGGSGTDCRAGCRARGCEQRRRARLRGWCFGRASSGPSRPKVFNHWLTLQLKGSRSNRQALGAEVHAGEQWAYVTTSGSYLSASDARVHFGLGGLTSVTVEITWPSGVQQVLRNVSVDRMVQVKEPGMIAGDPYPACSPGYAGATSACREWTEGEGFR